MYHQINAWREILARTFSEFTEQVNVSPPWLVNPATHRRLKLDIFYPEAGIAVRIVGLTAKGQGRQSDFELLETEQRDQTRAELCRQNGVQLFLLDSTEDVLKQLDHFLRVLARASRTLAQSDQPAEQKREWMPRLSAARAKADELRRLIGKNPAQMVTNLSESWRDREGSIDNEVDSTEQAAAPERAADVGDYRVGLRVRHERFGEGVITELTTAESDLRLTILFDAEQQRTFLASLVHNKLTVLA